ncbi:hypothetical protein ACM9XD_06105 [Xanthomonas sacchari]|uniref:hypothetical protein n=1 Tax=Xanthomonas TaxID=338 RepID=UPI0003820623|nr:MULTISPECIES: hypothetical protein [Xanthomonas]MCW0387396.1 hypothetical protein [Xanthomonas sacchari]MCW0451616.1 hypothetical protein [Xanthomonas sacchari]
MKSVVGWLLLFSSSWMLGAVLNDLASSDGLINLAHDRRGEWSALTAPIVASISLLNIVVRVA